MCFADQIQPGMYLAEIFAEGNDELEHHFVVFHRTEALQEPAEELLRTIWVAYPRAHPELVKVARIALGEDSLWEALRIYLLRLESQRLDRIHTVNFTYAPRHELRDRAEMAIAILNVMNRTQPIDAGVDGLMADPSDGALVLVLSCLQVLRLHASSLEDTQTINETLGRETVTEMIDRLQLGLERDRIRHRELAG